MDNNSKKTWKRFQRLSFDSKHFSKRVKKAETSTVRHARRFVVGRLDSIRASRRHIIVWMLAVGCVIAAVAVQLVWYKSSYETQAARPGGVYAEAAIGPIDTLNPLFASSSAERAASRLLFSSLYRYDAHGSLQGDLAEHIESDDTSRVHTVRLKSDVLWHDGRPVVAEDVVRTVELIKHPETRALLRQDWQQVSVEALDDRTVQFTLPTAYAAFTHALTFAVLPAHATSGIEPHAMRESAFSLSPIGSGPFHFNFLQTVNADRGERIVHMNANPRYYGPQPLISRFEVHSYRDSEAIVQALRRGAVSASADVSQAHRGEIDEYNYQTQQVPVQSGVYAFFNNDSPLLGSKPLRKALQLGTDTDAVRSSVAEHLPSLSLPFTASQIGSDMPSLPEHDIEAATALLDDEGWGLEGSVRTKDEQPLVLRVATTNDPRYEAVLEQLKTQWRQLGIEVVEQVMDTTDPNMNFRQMVLQPRDYDVLIYELAIGADLDVYAFWHSSQGVANGYNLANYNNAITDDNLSSARTTADTELRYAKYRAFARQWVEDAPAIGLYQQTMMYVHNRRAESVPPHSQFVFPMDRFTEVGRWSVERQPVYKTP